jgi:hypothetical protein
MLLFTLPMNKWIIVINLRSSVFQLDIENELIDFFLRKFPIKGVIIKHKTVLVSIDRMLIKETLKIGIRSPHIILTNVTRKKTNQRERNQ